MPPHAKDCIHLNLAYALLAKEPVPRFPKKVRYSPSKAASAITEGVYDNCAPIQQSVAKSTISIYYRRSLQIGRRNHLRSQRLKKRFGRFAVIREGL